MKYTVTVSGLTVDVEINGAEVSVNGRPADVRLAPIGGTPLWQLAVGSQVKTFVMSPGDDGWTVTSQGESWTVDVADERTRRLREMAGPAVGGAHGEVIRAPMPGLVLRLEVEEGQTIEPGTGVLVLEAMKMENEIRAGHAGTVTRVLVEPGSPVEKGTPLVEIGPVS